MKEVGLSQSSVPTSNFRNSECRIWNSLMCGKMKMASEPAQWAVTADKDQHLHLHNLEVKAGFNGDAGSPAFPRSWVTGLAVSTWTGDNNSLLHGRHGKRNTWIFEQSSNLLYYRPNQVLPFFIKHYVIHGHGSLLQVSLTSDNDYKQEPTRPR